MGGNFPGMGPLAQPGTEQQLLKAERVGVKGKDVRAQCLGYAALSSAGVTSFKKKKEAGFEAGLGVKLGERKQFLHACVCAYWVVCAAVC